MGKKRGRPARGSGDPSKSAAVDYVKGKGFIPHDCDILDQIAGLANHRALLEGQILGAVSHARIVHGASWDEVGQALGVSKQAAGQRYRALVAGVEADLRS